MSLVASNQIEKNRNEVEVSVDSETFKKAINAVYKRQVKNIRIPGFRPGKAPKAVVEKMYGKEVFYEDAIRNVYPQALQDAVEEAGLRVVPDKIDLDVTEASDDGVTFKAVVTTYPEVTINNYKGIEVEALSDEVTDEKIDEEIDKARQRASSIETVSDRPAENGDIAVIDFDGYVDGEAFEGGKAEGYSLTLGSGSFIPGFEDQIVGHSTGEEFSINVTFPEDYEVDELAGKAAEFKINLHEIKTRILPELDDDFVKDVSGESETVEDYRKEVAETLAEDLKKARDNDIENKLVDALIDLVDGDVPDAMYENKIDDMIREFEYRLNAQGLDLDTYVQYTGLTRDAFRDQYSAEAEKRVNIRLALEKIAELENIEISDEAVEEEYKKISDTHNTDLDRVKRAIPEKDLRTDLAVAKAMELVKENANIK